jgi:hypothetical protein
MGRGPARSLLLGSAVASSMLCPRTRRFGRTGKWRNRLDPVSIVLKKLKEPR